MVRRGPLWGSAGKLHTAMAQVPGLDSGILSVVDLMIRKTISATYSSGG